MSMEQQGKEKTKKIVAKIRKLVYLGVLIGVAWFFWRYDFMTIPSDYNHLAPQKMPAGSTIVALDYTSQVQLGIGSVVLYETPGHEGKFSFGVIAGLPGETLILVEEKRGTGRLQVADRRPELLPLPANHKLHSGVIPADQYLILNGDRHLSSGTGAPDGRVFGLVHQRNLKSKLIASFSAFAGG